MLKREVRTYGLKMTSIASHRVSTRLSYLPFISMFMRERRKSEDDTVHTTQSNNTL